MASDGIRDQNAAPMFATFETIKRARPRISILENVHGILRSGVWEHVLSLLNGLLADHFAVTVLTGMSPNKFCMPQLRNRVYMVIADRRHVNDNFQSTFLKHLSNVMGPPTSSFLELLSIHGPPQTPRLVTHPCGCTLTTSCPRNLTHINVTVSAWAKLAGRSVGDRRMAGRGRERGVEGLVFSEQGFKTPRLLFPNLTHPHTVSSPPPSLDFRIRSQSLVGGDGNYETLCSAAEDL
jgi:hypothetical protein